MKEIQDLATIIAIFWFTSGIGGATILVLICKTYLRTWNNKHLLHSDYVTQIKGWNLIEGLSMISIKSKESLLKVLIAAFVAILFPLGNGLAFISFFGMSDATRNPIYAIIGLLNLALELSFLRWLVLIFVRFIRNIESVT